MKKINDLEVAIRYTCEANISNSIKSVKKQSYLPHRINIIKNVYPSSASMQKAFCECNSRYLLVLDADQTLDLGAIEVLYKKIKESKNIFQVCGYIKYPWIKELGIGCGIRDMKYYRKKYKRKFDNRLNFDNFLWSLPKKLVRKVVCREMFFSDHLQFFNTFRRLMKRAKLRNSRIDLYLRHFCKAYAQTAHPVYLVGLFGMVFGLCDIARNENFDYSNDARKYITTEFINLMKVLKIKNRGMIIPEINFSQEKRVSWK